MEEDGREPLSSPLAWQTLWRKKAQAQAAGRILKYPKSGGNQQHIGKRVCFNLPGAATAAVLTPLLQESKTVWRLPSKPRVKDGTTPPQLLFTLGEKEGQWGHVVSKGSWLSKLPQLCPPCPMLLGHTRLNPDCPPTAYWPCFWSPWKPGRELGQKCSLDQNVCMVLERAILLGGSCITMPLPKN